ncbi:MAG: hypothetical protein AAFN59_08015, partial [Pseudomonadota bacterium]
MAVKSSLTAGALALLLTASMGLAQAATENRVSKDTDWQVFEEDNSANPKRCWAVTAPTETVNTRNGNVVSVNRSDILLMVFYQPDAEIQGQVTFTGGYPFAENSKATLEIGSDTFELITDGEWAWPSSADADARIVTAMKRGVNAIITARSSRGTVT